MQYLLDLVMAFLNRLHNIQPKLRPNHNRHTYLTATMSPPLPDYPTLFRIFLYLWIAWALYMIVTVAPRWLIVTEDHFVGLINITVTPIAPEDWNE